MKKGLKKFLSICLLGGGFYSLNPLKTNAAKLVGLANTGNSCYLNSAIQMLYSCDQFKQSVIQIANDSSVEKSSAAAQIASLFEEMDNTTSPEGEFPVISKEKLQGISELFSVNHKLGDDVDEAFSNMFKELKKNELGNRLCNIIHLASNVSITDGCMQVDISEEYSDYRQPLDVEVLLLQESENDPEKNCFLLCPPVDIPLITLYDSYSQFQLKSLSVNTGSHFMVWIRTDDNLWSCISDDRLEAHGDHFQDMLGEIFQNPNAKITSLMFCC